MGNEKWKIRIKQQMLLIRKIKSPSEKQTRLARNAIHGIPPLKMESLFVIIAAMMGDDENVNNHITSEF